MATKTSTFPIMESETLTSLLADRDNLHVRAKQSQTEITRLAKLIHPQYLDATVVRTDDARINPGVIAAAVDEQAVADDDEILRRILSGDSLGHQISNEEKLAQEHKQLAAIESAIWFVNRSLTRNIGWRMKFATG
jgi:hypothetical protein